tara:strand:+ start:5644 stop:6198 length:555 start_codon:yes stop_codon:yes gene_type:complete
MNDTIKPKKRSDSQMRDALNAAGVPKLYQKKDGKLQDHGEAGKRLKDMIDVKLHHEIFKGGVVEICGNDEHDHAAFCMFVRTMVVRNLPAAMIFAEFLLPCYSKTYNGRHTYDKIADYGAFAVEGLTPHKCNPYGDNASTVEWKLTKLLDDGAGMIILTDTPITDCEIWSPRFRSLIANRLIKY